MVAHRSCVAKKEPSACPQRSDIARTDGIYDKLYHSVVRYCTITKTMHRTVGRMNALIKVMIIEATMRTVATIRTGLNIVDS